MLRGHWRQAPVSRGRYCSCTSSRPATLFVHTCEPQMTMQLDLKPSCFTHHLGDCYTLFPNHFQSYAAFVTAKSTVDRGPSYELDNLTSALRLHVQSCSTLVSG
eukprot:366053-Chlamydomonas_euryale.AAC.4